MYITVLSGTTSSLLYKLPSLDVRLLDSNDSVAQLQPPSRQRDEAFLGWKYCSLHSVAQVYLFMQIGKHVTGVGVHLDGVEGLQMFLPDGPQWRK